MKKQKVKICHISDFHLPVPGHVPAYRLFSKRILGFANHRWNRAKKHKEQQFYCLFDRMLQEEPDLVIITGDISNLSLESEFELMAEYFQDKALGPEKLIVIPGNHDRYTPGAQFTKRFERFFSKWLPFYSDEKFPVFVNFENVSVIGLCSSVFRGPLRAAGQISTYELKRLEKLLKKEEIKKNLIIAVHHPPFYLEGGKFKHYFNGLSNYEALLDILKGKKAIVLHGHTHKSTDCTINDTRIIGISSASCVTDCEERKLAFNVLECNNTEPVKFNRISLDL